MPRLSSLQKHRAFDQSGVPRPFPLSRLRSGSSTVRALIVLALLTGGLVAAANRNAAAMENGPAADMSIGCTAGPLTLARSQILDGAPSRGSAQTPSDVTIADGYRFVVLGSVGLRLWPDSKVKLDSMARSGERVEAACKIRAPNGSSWLAVRSLAGILRYIPASATDSVDDHDASLLRMHDYQGMRPGQGTDAARPAR